VANTEAFTAEAVLPYESLADIDRGFRVPTFDIESGPVRQLLRRRIHVLARVCFIALILYRVMPMLLTVNDRREPPARLPQQLQCIHRECARSAIGQALD